MYVSVGQDFQPVDPSQAVLLEVHKANNRAMVTSHDTWSH